MGIMQLTLPFAIENRLVRAHELLSAAFGPVVATHRMDPVSQMVFAMLSGRTRDEIARAAFEGLANSFPSWEPLARMRVGDLQRRIALTTFPEKKAIYVPGALQTIMRRRHGLDLEFLERRSVSMAQDWLETLPGVGAKTSAAVLNFSTLHKRVLCVDTAHHRVAVRFGLVPRKASLDRASRLLNLQIPDHWTADDTETHHVLMQGLGKTLCTHGRPRCAPCPLRLMCPSAAASADAPPPAAIAAPFHQDRQGG
jgi:endonuclease-3